MHVGRKEREKEKENGCGGVVQRLKRQEIERNLEREVVVEVN